MILPFCPHLFYKTFSVVVIVEGFLFVKPHLAAVKGVSGLSTQCSASAWITVQYWGPNSNLLQAKRGAVFPFSQRRFLTAFSVHFDQNLWKNP